MTDPGPEPSIDAASSRHVLDPLADRYASCLTRPAHLTADVSDEDPALVRAMPVILRVERTDPPSRTLLLEAAAAAALAVCLDERAAPGGPWYDDVLAWTTGRIRKVSRRARGVHWDTVGELPGRTVSVAGAEVRALVPGLVADTPKVVSRLQITGTDLPDDDPVAVPVGVPVLWLNPHVPLTTGKAAAQVGHATMLLAALLHADRRDADLAWWSTVDYRCAVRVATKSDWHALHPADDPATAWRTRAVVAVRDAGFTEIAPGTFTVLATWPTTTR
jgi:peptidyl-tRNA hydrolase